MFRFNNVICVLKLKLHTRRVTKGPKDVKQLMEPKELKEIKEPNGPKNKEYLKEPMEPNYSNNWYQMIQMN